MLKGFSLICMLVNRRLVVYIRRIKSLLFDGSSHSTDIVYFNGNYIVTIVTCKSIMQYTSPLPLVPGGGGRSRYSASQLHALYLKKITKKRERLLAIYSKLI